MTRFAFTQVDVFAESALLGNPLAVEHEGDTVWVGGQAISCVRGEVAL